MNREGMLPSPNARVLKNSRHSCFGDRNANQNGSFWVVHKPLCVNCEVEKQNHWDFEDLFQQIATRLTHYESKSGLYTEKKRERQDKFNVQENGKKLMIIRSSFQKECGDPSKNYQLKSSRCANYTLQYFATSKSKKTIYIAKMPKIYNQRYFALWNLSQPTLIVSFYKA